MIIGLFQTNPSPIPSLPGGSISYNATTSYNWDAKGAGNRLTLPLGLGVGKTIDMGGGYGLDMGLGFYANVVRPDGAVNWKINWAFSVLFPQSLFAPLGGNTELVWNCLCSTWGVS